MLGYGNPGRQDDAIGPDLAAGVEALGLPGVQVLSDFQLNIEHADHLARAGRAIFVDAAVEGEEPFSVRRLAPSPVIHFTTHALGPESMLAVCEDAFGRSPDAVLVAVRGYGFEFADGLTAKAAANRARALEYILSLIEDWRDVPMTAGQRGKTVLIIDDDPDMRAAIRVVLESAGYGVGEASNGEEGLKTARSIRPDAILLDLMMETVDAGSRVSSQLKSAGFTTPVFLLSAAGEAVRYNIDPAELGLAGIFQKPLDNSTLLATLETQLGGGRG